MTSTTAPQVRTDPDEQLTGRELRRLTARVTAAHAGRGAGQVVVDVAYTLVSIVLAIGIVVGVVSAVGDVVTADQAWTLGAGEGVGARSGAALPPGVLQLLVTAVALALVVSAAARLGPAGVGAAGVHWWLPTRADRRGLLLPSVGRALGAGTLAGAVGGVLAGLGAGVDPGGVLLGAAVAAPAGAVVVALAGLAQGRPGGSRSTAAVGDALVAAVPVLGLGLVATGTVVAPPGSAPGVVGGVSVLLTALALALAGQWARRVDRLPLPTLVGRSGAMERVGSAMTSLDVRELGRALDSGARTRRRRRGRGAPGGVPRSFGLVRGPRGALVVADATLLARTTSAWTQLVGLVCLLALTPLVPGLAAGPGLVVVTAAVGARAGQLGAAGARAAEVVPALDASLPLSARGVRAARIVVPAITAALALAVGLVPLALVSGSASWVLLAALVGVGCGAGAVRAALRREPDWSGPLLATPSGAVPVDVVSVLRQGLDLVVLSILPFAVAALLGTVTPVVLAVQVTVTVVALAVAAHAPAR